MKILHKKHKINKDYTFLLIDFSVRGLHVKSKRRRKEGKNTNLRREKLQR